MRQIDAAAQAKKADETILDKEPCDANAPRYLGRNTVTKATSAKPEVQSGLIITFRSTLVADAYIAARIEPLAEADGICISQQVFDQVENRIPKSLKKMGPVKLKNMIRPLEVYQVLCEGAASGEREQSGFDPAEANRSSETQKSIAVLPFLNMSSDPENEYLSDGLTEDLIMAFSQLKGLRVPARTSSFAFKGRNEDIRHIGQQLNVKTILEGSVRKVGNRLRITAQLINVADADHLWSQTFDREMQEVFAIQDEITRAIVQALEMQLIGAGDQPLTKHGTYNTEAYQLYLQARYHYNKFTGEGFRRCIECCKKALQIEPNYALAYAALSLSYQIGWHYGHLSLEEKLAPTVRRDLGPEKAAVLDPNLAEAQTDDLLIEALSKPLFMVKFWNRAAEKAVELDPNLAEAQTVLAMVRFWNERDWPAAEDCFKQALKLNPNYVTAHEHYAGALICMRQEDDAITHARLAQQLDPLSPMIIMHTGFVYWISRRYDLMLEQARTLFDLQSGFFGGYWASGLAHWGQGRHEAAIAELRKAVTLGGGPMPLADLGCLLGRLDRKAEAQRVLEDLGELGRRVNVQPTYVGFVHAGLGNHDEAFACFSRGLEQQNASIMWLREYCTFAGLDRLRGDPRFPALLEKIGVEAWAPQGTSQTR